MTRDQQIVYLIKALKSIRDDYAPYRGKGAVAMRLVAQDTLKDWKGTVPASNDEEDHTMVDFCGNIYRSTKRR